jgi:hypothetical protein
MLSLQFSYSARNLASGLIDGYYHNQPIFLLGYPASPAVNTTLLRRRSMKLVKNLVFALVLAFVLAISAPAGELNTPGAAPTPTPTPQEAVISPDGGTVVSDPIDGTTETADYLFFETLAALLSMY